MHIKAKGCRIAHDQPRTDCLYLTLRRNKLKGYNRSEYGTRVRTPPKIVLIENVGGRMTLSGRAAIGVGSIAVVPVAGTTLVSLRRTSTCETADPSGKVSIRVLPMLHGAFEVPQIEIQLTAYALS